MRRARWTILLLFSFPFLALGQAPQESWDDLKQLRTGQKIQVVDIHMKTLNGAFLSFSAEALGLRVGKGEVSVSRPDVVRVSVRDTSKRMRNMLLGAGIAGGVALAVGIPIAVTNSNEGNTCAVCFAGIAAGFGGGAALGAIPGSRTIYRVPKK